MLEMSRPTLLVALIAVGGLAGTLGLRALLPPGNRLRGRATGLLLLLAILVAVLATLAEAVGLEGADVGLRLVATLLLVCGLVGAFGMLLFDVVLHRLGVMAPTIL